METATAALAFVIPARDAATTLGATVASLRAQTRPDWEAVVVDDASTDGTDGLAERLAVEEPRLRVVRRSRAGGASAARNDGVAATGAPAVCFLDADDTVTPHFAARMLDALESDPCADAALCGYVRTDPDGAPIAAYTRPDPGDDAFETLAHRQVTAIHAHVVRRRALDAVGGFDPQLTTCEDWDLWLRLARAGTRYAIIDAPLAIYRCAPGTLSRNGALLVADARTVLRRALGSDARVRAPAHDHVEGIAADRVEATCRWIALWAGAIALGAGGDPGPCLAEIREAPPDFLTPDALTGAVLDGLVIGLCRPESALADWWPAGEAGLDALLADFARRACDPTLAEGIKRRLALRACTAGEPADRRRFGPVLAVRGGVSPLLRRIVPPPGVDTLALRRGAGRVVALPMAGPVSRLAWLRLMAAFAVLRVEAALRPREIGRLPPDLARRRPTRLARRALRAAAARLSGGRAADSVDALSPLPPPRPPPAGAKGHTGSPPGSPAAAETRGTFWEAHFAEPDPWQYDSPYEVEKYERTLSLLPDGPIGDALELACAEGHFTRRLAPRVARLEAVDISERALARARERCRMAGIDGVRFARADFFAEPIAGDRNLIVCSEVLYYLDDPARLADLAARIADALAPGGLLLTAHANLLADDPARTGFDWDHPYGADGVVRAFEGVEGLARVRTIRTELYRIDLFRRAPADGPAEEIGLPVTAPLSPAVEAGLVRGGALARRAAVWRSETTARVPVLMYHRVSDTPVPALARYAVSPREFEAQMRFLRRRGFHAIAPDALGRARRDGVALAGRPVLITFDDGYRDFAETAWPILERHGFTAHVFVVTGSAGGTADWDAAHGPPAPLMDMEAIRALHGRGVTFGSHMDRHMAVTCLSIEALARAADRARRTLEDALGTAIDTVAPPYGDHDDRTVRVLAAAGHRLVFTTVSGIADSRAATIRVPRLEIAGGMDLDAFAAAVAQGLPTPEDADRP
ncbi:MAG: glycosyltransferase [Azospirillaceae bacterium]